MPTNEEIVNKSMRQKVDLTVSQLQANGGYLPEEMAASYAEIAIGESVILEDIRYEDMQAETKKVPATHFTGRVARAATSHQALPPSDRVAPTMARAELVAKEIIAEVFIGDDELDNDITGEDLENIVKERLGRAFGRDMEELVVNGDTASADVYLALFDGMFKLATTNVEDFGTAVMSDTNVTDLFVKMPKEARTKHEDLRMYVGSNAHLNYLNTIAQRQDERGSKVHLEGGRIFFLGVEIKKAHVIPEDLGGGGANTQALFLHPENAVYGLQRKMRVEAERSARMRGTTWVLTAKPAFDFVYEPHVAKGTNILST